MFWNVFLSESPMRLNGNNDFHMQLEMLRENLANNGSARCVAPGMAAAKHLIGSVPRIPVMCP